MKMMYFYFVFAIYLAISPMQVIASDKGQEEGVKSIDRQIISTVSNQVQCYQSPKYFVVEKDIMGKAGNDILVKYKLQADENLPCSYVLGNNDFEIKNEWAEHFANLKDDLLFLESYTGPCPCGFIIWDLKKRKKVYEGSFSGPTEIKDDSFIYWTETGEATDDNCPERAIWESQGLGAAIETKVILNLSDFRVSKTKETRCSPRQ